MPEIRPEDRQLAGAVRKSRGGVTALARHYRVSIQTASGWGVRRSFPRHVRESVAKYIAGPAAVAARALPDADDRSTLVPPEGAMDDPTFQRVWAHLATIWKHRNDKTKDEWEALVSNMKLIGKHVKAEPMILRQPDGELRHIDISTGVRASGKTRRKQ